jgi:hypothetical protein
VDSREATSGRGHEPDHRRARLRADAERLDAARDILRRRLGAETLAAAIRHGAAMDDHKAVRWTRARLLEFVREPALR